MIFPDFKRKNIRIRKKKEYVLAIMKDSHGKKHRVKNQEILAVNYPHTSTRKVWFHLSLIIK